MHAVAVEAHLPHYAATVGEVRDELQHEQAEAARLLAQARERARAAGVSLKTEVVAGHVAQGTFETARREKVSRHAACSVLIVRSG